MRKGICLWIAAALLLMTSAASANSWGLSGRLYQLVSDVDTWSNYSTVGNQAGDWAVMGTKHHNALFYAAQDGLHVCHTAVYQPGDRRGAPKLTRQGDTLTLAYGKDESYTFTAYPADPYGSYDGTPVLTSARIGGMTVEADHGSGDSALDFNSYLCTDASGTARYVFWGLTVDRFSIRLFPRSTDEVRSLNLMRAALASGDDCLGWPGGWQTKRKLGTTTVPVTSAPFGKSAWRAAKGKAAVGLKGSVTLLAGYTDADGESFTCVGYEVNDRTHRIGWVLTEELGAAAPEMAEAGLVRVETEAVRKTFLTDDPLCSMAPQFDVPAGTQFTCLGLFRGDWAYVEAEVSTKGTFTDGGAIVWGFVPLRDLGKNPHLVRVRQDVMDGLAGSWIFSAGGSMADDALILRADGTFDAACEVLSENGDVIGLSPTRSGSWYVTDYNAGSWLYWNNPPYEITLVGDDGTAIVKGLTPDEDGGFSLTDNEGGGGYIRTDAETAEPHDESDPDIHG